MGLTTRGVLTFLLISFGLAWGAVLVAHLVLDMSLVNPLVQLPIAFSPAIAAVIVRKWVTREGFRDAGLRPHVRTAGFYYLLAWIGPVLVLAVTIGLAVALGLYRPDFSPLRQVIPGMELPEPVGLLVLAVPVLLLPAFWGEEFGWRSYLQLRVSGESTPGCGHHRHHLVRVALPVGLHGLHRILESPPRDRDVDTLDDCPGHHPGLAVSVVGKCLGALPRACR
jgi:membrane protease YdiL (CAAX protease family)